jgi:hypothetical protein
MTRTKALNVHEIGSSRQQQRKQLPMLAMAYYEVFVWAFAGMSCSPVYVDNCLWQGSERR